MTNNESGLSVLNVDEAVQLLSNSYISIINKETPLFSFPSVMLWGPPGIGKSQAVRQIAEQIQIKTGKSVKITDVRLLLFNPVDLRGIPTANADKTLAVWLKPQIFQMNESSDVVNILLLDEISAAPQSVQAAAYQITLDRAIGEHKLPDNCIVIAAGNRVTDKSVAYNMPRALANRLLHLEIKGDPNSWHDWAIRNGLHKYVISYLEYNPTALLRADGSEMNLAFPTPRSWEMVSNVLANVSDDIPTVRPLITGCIGSSATYSFEKWCTLFESIPKAEQVFNGRKVSVKNMEELLIALRSDIVSYAAARPERAGVNNCIDFAVTQPWAFRTALLHDFALLPQLKDILDGNDVYEAALKVGLK